MDGTLVDSPLCFRTLRRELDIPLQEPILEYLALLPPSDQKIKLHRLEELELVAAQNATVISGVEMVLAELHATNIRLGLFTRNCRSVMDLVLKNLNLKFHKTISREEAPAKPHPAGLHVFLQEWELQRDDLLYVGDYKYDIDCGRRAGVKTALFHRFPEQKNDWTPDLVFHDFKDFLGKITNESELPALGSDSSTRGVL